MINYRIEIVDIEVTKAIDNLIDVVYNFSYKVIGEKDGVSKEIINKVHHLPYDKNTFTDYSSLTENQVISWIPEDALTATKNKIEAQILEELDSPLIVKNLPW